MKSQQIQKCLAVVVKSQQIQSCLAVVVVGLALGSAQNVRAAEEVDYQPFSLTAEAGTLGLGGSLSWRFSDHLGVRGGFNYFAARTF